MLLSIITINYNNAAGLQKTMENVTGQTCKNFEYIVVDGGSTDESVEVIKRFSSRIHKWVSEKDGGIFFGMNKGIQMADGDYILFVNSGDLLATDTTIEEVVPSLKDYDIIYGDYEVVEREKKWIKQYPSTLSFSHFFHDSLPHTAGAFFKRAGFKNELATYNIAHKIVADWEWHLIAIFRYNYTYKHLDTVIGVYDHTGNSTLYPAETAKEKRQVFEKEFPAIYKEISSLLVYKTKYETLAASRLLSFWLKCKKLLKFS